MCRLGCPGLLLPLPLVQNRWKYHENEDSFLLIKYVRSIILDFEKFFHPIPSNPFYFVAQP